MSFVQNSFTLKLQMV